jgi:hypothetical protein
MVVTSSAADDRRGMPCVMVQLQVLACALCGPCQRRAQRRHQGGDMLCQTMGVAVERHQQRCQNGTKSGETSSRPPSSLPRTHRFRSCTSLAWAASILFPTGAAGASTGEPRISAGRPSSPLDHRRGRVAPLSFSGDELGTGRSSSASNDNSWLLDRRWRDARGGPLTGSAGACGDEAAPGAAAAAALSRPRVWCGGLRGVGKSHRHVLNNAQGASGRRVCACLELNDRNASASLRFARTAVGARVGAADTLRPPA